jgi:hypothetical protein
MSDSNELYHFLDLVNAGRLRPTASTGEKKAYAIAVALVENVPGLDDQAVAGLAEFVRLAGHSVAYELVMKGRA